jgi:uncharacterized protein
MSCYLWVIVETLSIVVGHMELSLFPLKNTVLFPGMPLNLYIFEERYKLMINECIEQEKPFGVLLIESGSEAYGPLATPHTIGCTANITQVQRLSFDRMNILAVGRDRFQVRQVHQDRAYLYADVDMLPFEESNPRDIMRGGRRLKPLIEKYLNALEQAGQLQLSEDSQLPSDPISLAYLASVVLQTESTQKQSLLEAESTATLLEQLVNIYRKEVTLLNIMLAPPPEQLDEHNPFSVN